MHCFSNSGQDGECWLRSAGPGHQLQPQVFTCRESGCKLSQVPLGETVIHNLALVSVLEMAAWICISFRFFSCTHQVQKLTSRSALWIFTLQCESRSRNFHKNAKCDHAHAKKSSALWHCIPQPRSWICRIYRPHLGHRCAGRWGSCQVSTVAAG